MNTFTSLVNQYELMMNRIESINKNFLFLINMNTNNILNLFFIKNLYINSLIDTINIVAYKKLYRFKLNDSTNHITTK